MNESREKLEKEDYIACKLKGYTFIENNVLMSNLKIGYFIRYIKKSDEKNTKPHVAIGGKISEILEDVENIGHVYLIRIKTNRGTTFNLKLKDNENIYLYYKIHTVEEQRILDAQEWKKKLTPYERKKFTEMHVEKQKLDNKIQRKLLSDKFYVWLYKRRPDLKPLPKEKKQKSCRRKKLSKDKSKTKSKSKSKVPKVNTTVKNKAIKSGRIVRVTRAKQ